MTPFQQKQLALMRQMELTFASGAPASTIVPMQADYKNDTQMCLTYVTFIPKEIAVMIQRKLISTLSAIEPDFYYYPEDALHVTIQNIRVIHDPPHFGPHEIAKAKELLSTLTSHYSPFLFEFAGILSLPTSLAIIVLTSPEYDEFVKLLRQELNRAGIPDDKTYFTNDVVFTNTTICRYVHQPSKKFIDEVQKHRSEFFGTMSAKNVSLIQTNAGAHPSKTTILAPTRSLKDSFIFKPL